MTKVMMIKKTSPKGTPLLIPIAEDHDFLAKKKDDQSFEVQIRNVRSMRQHRMFFAMLRKAFDNQVRSFPNIEALRHAVLLECGHCRPQMRMNGEVILVADSMAVGNMDGDTFNNLIDDAAACLCKYVLPEGTDPEDLKRECRDT